MHASLLSTLPSFVKVVEKQSFSKAARELGMTKSAVSKHIQALEDGLKVRLLNRTTRSLALTEEGELFYRTASHLVEELASAEAKLASVHDRPTGMLKVNAPESFGALHLAGVLTAYAKACPEVQLEVSLTDRFVNIIEEGVDVAIRVASLTDSSLIARKLARCQMVLAASPGYLAEHGTPTHPDELINHRFVEYSYSDRPNEFRYRMVDGKQGVASISPVFRANNGQMLREAAKAGLGIVYTPSFILGEDIKSGTLTRLMPELGASPERNIYALYPHSRYLSAKVRMFIDAAAEAFREPCWEV